MPQHANPITKLGKPSPTGYTSVPNTLIRDGVAEFGSDGLAILTLLMSHQTGWETSARAISEDWGWGRNRNRVAAALAKLVAAQRVVIRDHVRVGGGRVRQEYVLHADGSRLSDDERDEYSHPLLLKPKGCTDTVQGDEP